MAETLRYGVWRCERGRQYLIVDIGKVCRNVSRILLGQKWAKICETVLRDFSHTRPYQETEEWPAGSQRPHCRACR
jgi:hypothetical protein